MVQMEECLCMLEQQELDPAHCRLWRLPPRTRLLHFVKDKQVLAVPALGCRAGRRCNDALHRAGSVV